MSLSFCSFNIHYYHSSVIFILFTFIGLNTKKEKRDDLIFIHCEDKTKDEHSHHLMHRISKYNIYSSIRQTVNVLYIYHVCMIS